MKRRKSLSHFSYFFFGCFSFSVYRTYPDFIAKEVKVYFFLSFAYLLRHFCRKRKTKRHYYFRSNFLYFVYEGTFASFARSLPVLFLISLVFINFLYYYSHTMYMNREYFFSSHFSLCLIFFVVYLLKIVKRTLFWLRLCCCYCVPFFQVSL